MGCDIHAHTEIKINGVWHHLNTLDMDRNYTVFARMAGVRNRISEPIEPIAEPRGMPEDPSFITQYDCNRWSGDGHSHSWLSAAEVAELGSWMEALHKDYSSDYWYCEKVIGYIFGNGWEVFTKYRDEIPAGVEDARLVFWFDN